MPRYGAAVGRSGPAQSGVLEVLEALKVDGKGGDDHGGIVQYYEDAGKASPGVTGVPASGSRRAKSPRHLLWRGCGPCQPFFQDRRQGTCALRTTSSAVLVPGGFCS